MDRLTELRGRRATLAARAAELRGNGHRTEEQETQYTEAIASLEAVDTLIEAEEVRLRGENSYLRQFRDANGRTYGIADLDGSASPPGYDSRDLRAGIDGAAVIDSTQSFRSLIQAEAPPEHRNVRPGDVLRYLATGRGPAEVRDMIGASDPAGGYTLPEFLSAEIIDLARARTVVMRAGARSFNLEGATRVPVVTADPQTEWHAELQQISSSRPSFGAANLAPKTLVSLTVMSRELLEDGVGAAGALERSMSGAMAVEFDRAALFGSGIATMPLGIDGWPDVRHVALGTGNGGFLNGFGDLVNLRELLTTSNLDGPRAFVMAPRTESDFARLKDGEGLQMDPPRELRNVPFLMTTSDCTSIIAGDWRDLWVGVRAQLRIEVLRERYADQYGIGFLAALRADTVVVRSDSFAVLTGIRPFSAQT
jgi:HK97 family phage major capsid protein